MDNNSRCFVTGVVFNTIIKQIFCKMDITGLRILPVDNNSRSFVTKVVFLKNLLPRWVQVLHGRLHRGVIIVSVSSLYIFTTFCDHQVWQPACWTCMAVSWTDWANANSTGSTSPEKGRVHWLGTYGKPWPDPLGTVGSHTLLQGWKPGQIAWS